ncbi:hypothetical protein FACS1894123_11900 [Bacteroidia bacterium]|nr:hypothetical protein FACS1894123_11900 [Bacteroidia bacterium]
MLSPQNIEPNKLPQKPNQFIIFKTEDDNISVDVRFESETAWLTKPRKGMGKIGFPDVGKTKKNSRRETKFGVSQYRSVERSKHVTALHSVGMQSSVETTKYPPLTTFRRNVTNEISK